MRPESSIDLVHMRNMSGAFADWPHVYSQALHCLRPGGWIEVLDFDDHRSAYARNFYSRFPPTSEIHHVAAQMAQGTARDGRRRGTFHMEPGVLRAAGFVDVEVREFSIPLSPVDNSLGKLWLIACLHGIEAGSMRVLTQHMGWDPHVAAATLARIQAEFKALALNPETGRDFMVNLRVATARKPLVEGFETASSLTENGTALAADTSGDESTIGAPSA
jgi:hypothetical protein